MRRKRRWRSPRESSRGPRWGCVGPRKPPIAAGISPWPMACEPRSCSAGRSPAPPTWPRASGPSPNAAKLVGPAVDQFSILISMTWLTDFRTRLRRLATTDPDVVVAMRPDRSCISAGDLLVMAEQVVTLLGDSAAGRRVGVAATNTVEAVAALHGVWLAGGSAVLIGPMTPAAEADRRLAVTGCVAHVTPGPEPRVSNLDPDDDARADGEAVVIFTSGTTGLAKAASIPFRSLESSARTIATGLGVGTEGRALASPPRTPQVVFVALAHMGGLLATQTSWSVGKPFLFVPKFDADT